jgi:hypothetical protein
MATLSTFQVIQPLAVMAPTSGTPVQVGSFYTSIPTGNPTGQVHAISVQALPGNTNVVYVLINPTNPASPPGAADTTNYTNVLAVLSAGQSWSSVYAGADNISPSWIWVDVNTTGDKALASSMGY